jgi:hypothetical protein
MASKTTAADSPRPWSSRRRRAFSARQVAQRRAISGRRSSGGSAPSSAARRRSAVTTMSPCTGTSTGWKRPGAMGSRSTCTTGSLGVMPVWLEKDPPITSRRSASFMNQLAMGVPLRPRTPQPSGWWSETRPLPSRVVSTGALSRSARRRTPAICSRAPWPTITTGRRAARSRSDARASASAGGAMAGSPTRPAGPGAGTVSGTGRVCTPSGKIRCETSRPTIACFRASAISSAWRLSGWTVWLQPATPP